MATSGKEGNQKKKGGFFSGMGSALNKMGKEIEKGVDSASTSINKTIDENWKSDKLACFKTNMQVQLVSRTSSKALQYHNGELNALGEVEAEEVKAGTWHVLNDGNNIVRIHVDNHYLAIENGTTMAKHYSDPAQTGPETRLRLQQSGAYIMFESVAEGKSHVGVDANGCLKPALVTARGDPEAMFGVRVLYSPYPPPQKK